jgi:hypothetical protein
MSVRPLSGRVGAFLTTVAVLDLTAAGPLAAQETSLEAQVEGIAGADIYLSVGTNRGIGPGTVLVVLGGEGEDEAGRLRVIEAMSTRSINTFVGTPFPVTRGATLSLRIEAAADGPAPPRPAAAAAGAAAARGSTSRSRTSSGPRVSGSLGLSFDARETITSWDEFDLEEVERRFSTPTVALRLGVAQLPGGIDFRTNLRGSYRSSTDDIVQPEEFVRVYSLELRKDFGSVQASLGRIYNPYEPASGYFDGAYVHVGRREGFGGGVAGGLRPSRENGGITDSIPKYSLFANYSDRSGALRYDVAVSFTQEMPKSGDSAEGVESLSNHSYVGLTQTLRTGPIRLRHSMTVDRDPADDAWKVSRLLLGASLPIVGGLTAHARYSLRQPYRVEQVVPITYRRDRANLGLTFGANGSMIGADVTANDVMDDGIGKSWTYSGWFSVPRTSLLELGFTGSVSFRDRDGDQALYVVPGLTRRFGQTLARLAYTYYHTEEPAAVFTTHAGDLSVDFPLARRLRGTLAGRIQRGAQLDANSIYVSLWWAF